MNNEKFASRLGFILVSAGCAIGLGNVWKFPYICGENGGAAFIIIYLLCLFLLGLPILVCEFAIGRGSGKSVGKSFDVLEKKGTLWHRFKWFGFAGNYLLMMFYTMVAGWMVYYIFVMASGKIAGKSETVVKEQFDNLLGSPEILIGWALFIIVVCIGICALGLQKGIEKITKVIMVLLIVLMIVMAINSLTLKGSMEGLKFYFIPDFKRMANQGMGNVIFAAMTHAFFTLSVGMGSMEIFGSYMGKERKIYGEAISVVVLDTMIALVAGLIIIPACFACGVEPDNGPSLLFITLPNVFNKMPYGSVWGTMFFLFMTFAAMSTVIAVLENIIAITVDLFNIERKKSILFNLIGISVMSLPAILGYNLWSNIKPFGDASTIMDLEDFLVSYNILPLGSLLFVMFCCSKNGWGFENMIRETNTGTGRSFPIWIKNYMKYIVPIIILVIYFKGYYDKFAPMGIVTLIFWMFIAVILVGFMSHLIYGKKK